MPGLPKSWRTFLNLASIGREILQVIRRGVLKNIFKPRTDWPGDSPRIRRGVQKQNVRPSLCHGREFCREVSKENVTKKPEN